MTLTISTNAKQQALLLPLEKTDDLATILQQVADAYQLNARTLIADFKADAKEVLTMYAGPKGQKIFLLGLGAKPSSNDVINVTRHFSYHQKSRLVAQLAVNLAYIKQFSVSRYAEIICNGLAQGTYQLGLHKTETATVHPLKGISFIQEEDTVKKAAAKGLTIATTQMAIFDLVNQPANHKTPTMLGKWAKASGKKHGFDVKVLDKAACLKTGLHALLSVNAGSPEDPAFIIMEYKGKGKKMPKVGLVGKGVTFDTGGISIKGSANMHYMKSDMGGAAAVLGTMELVAKLGLNIHLIGIVPSTENCVDGASTKPSNVVQSYLGKTIEVIDTDAEGRIILADGLAYMAKEYKPDVIIDLATLTGSCIQTFGYACSGMLSNNDALAAALSTAGDESGERVWRLPLWDAYSEDISSDVADVRNYSGKPMAGAISAAKFLEVFIDKHPNWAHLDIAGVAFNTMEYGAQKCSTAYGIRLLLAYMEGL